MSKTIFAFLIDSIRSASVFNPEIQVPPACILWPDRDRQWQPIIPRLQSELPELLILGDYTPEKRTGPAIWLRCVIARKSDDVSLPEGRTPILYLPGISRQELRAIQSCPDNLKPLAELQYRGVIWSQINGKDWTILAFLKSDQGGLGLDVAQDDDTKKAMQLAIYHLLDDEIEPLKGKWLGKDYFNTVLSGGDHIRDLLQWLDQGEAFQNGRGENQWTAFVEVCKSQLAFNPENEGMLAGAAKLAVHEGPWRAAWERFCEAPMRYLNIPARIRKCKPPEFPLFVDTGSAEGWPQWNDVQESALQQRLLALEKVPAHEARNQLLEMEKHHGHRRQLVWAELGEAPLACAMEHLGLLSEVTKHSLAAGSASDLEFGYSTQGWKADDAVIQALSCVKKKQDFDAVSKAIRSVYLPWAEESARHLQKIVDEETYPGGTIATSKVAPRRECECVLFVDGLRFDTAKQLIKLLDSAGCKVVERTTWAALPSVTATGKAAVTPVRDKIWGEDANADFEPSVAGTGQSLKGGYHLKKLLTDNGWRILEGSDNGDGQGNAWCEFGNIDHEGHDRGWKLANHIDILLGELRDYILALLEAGWKSIRVVTDHGWLLLPGGLPNIDMPSALTDNKWGRCASLKPGASSKERLYPWFWNPNHHFAFADGVSCFRKGEEYTHGGLSLQECLTSELTISKTIATVPAMALDITDIVWKGMRCTVAVEGQFSELSLDVRTQPGNPLSSVVVSAKHLKDNGTASVVVENEELEGQEATIVLLDANGGVVTQSATVIGKGSK